MYFGVDSFHDLKLSMSKFVDSMAKPFRLQYDPITQSVRPDKDLVRLDQTNSGDLQKQKQKEYFENLKKNFTDHGAASEEAPFGHQHPPLTKADLESKIYHGFHSTDS